MFFSVSFKLIVGLIGAVLLNANLWGRSAFRVFVMPPWIVPIAIGCLGWLWLYNGYFWNYCWSWYEDWHFRWAIWIFSL